LRGSPRSLAIQDLTCTGRTSPLFFTEHAITASSVTSRTYAAHTYARQGRPLSANPAHLPGSWMRFHLPSTTGNINRALVVAQPAVLPKSAGRDNHPSHGACMHARFPRYYSTPFLLARSLVTAAVQLASIDKVRADVCASPRLASWLAPKVLPSIHLVLPRRTYRFIRRADCLALPAYMVC
jgi:hypothetical protein